MLYNSHDLLTSQLSLELFSPKFVKEKPETLEAHPVARYCLFLLPRLFEDDKVKCYVCKTVLDNHTNIKQHLHSKLHKENANSHCIYRRPKVLKNKVEKVVYRVPEAKKINYQKALSESSVKGVMTPKTVASTKTSTFSSPVYRAAILD